MMETDIAVGAGLKITCDRDELALRLGAVSRVVSSRGTVQVLAGVLLHAREGLLELAATDMELSLRTTLAAQIEGDGAVVVPGKLLVDLTRLLPAGEVTIEYRPEEGVAEITAGSYSSRLNIFAAEDFPRLPSIDVPLHAVETASLLDTVDRVSRSASRDESRPVLTGIQVRFEGQTLAMAATDSYRLSFKRTDLPAAGPTSRRSSPPALWRSCRASRPGRRRPDGDQRQHGRVRRRRRVADDAPHRRAVPRRQPSSPRQLRGRGGPAARRAPRRRPARSGDGATQRSAPPSLRRG